MTADKKDLVNHPPHYTHGEIEVIDAIEAWELEYHESNIVKYVARAQHKGKRLEDLRKAQWYLARKIALLEKKVSEAQAEDVKQEKAFIARQHEAPPAPDDTCRCTYEVGSGAPTCTCGKGQCESAIRPPYAKEVVRCTLKQGHAEQRHAHGPSGSTWLGDDRHSIARKAECSCGEKFRAAEDYRDHLPCEGKS